MKRGGFSKGEELLALQLRTAGLPAPVRQHRFHKIRRWRFDFSWPELMVAAEVEGVVYFGRARGIGRHQSRKGIASDCEKYNTALSCGWKVYRFTPDMIQSGDALMVLRLALAD